MAEGMGPYRHVWRAKLFLAQGGLCFYCGKSMSMNRRADGQPARDFATFEHLERLVDGGKTNALNLVLAHRKCNAEANALKQARG